MTTRIEWNGSRHLGQEPATLAELLLALAHHPIGAFWRKHGIESSYLAADGTRWWTFWGNFEDVSHCFSVDTDEPALADEFRALFRANRHLTPHPCMRDGTLGANAERCPCYASHFGSFERRESA
jgi:hypothetical protein